MSDTIARYMGESSVPVLRIEDGGRVVRGVALPFGEVAIIPEGDGFVAEVMDEQSVSRIADNIPLLISHDRDRPAAGVVRHSLVTSRGLGIEAELVGSASEIEGWRERFRRGLSCALSIGFTRDKRRDIFERPLRPGGLPTVRRRGVVIHEISLCQWAAYPTASVLSLNVRTAADEDLHERSQEVFAWAAARRAPRTA